MPFGLTNASTTFQAYINRALAGLLNNICVVYLNDILIYTYSNNIGKHQVAVRRVLDRLRKAALYANLKKYTFVAKEVKFLGFIIKQDSVAADLDKISTITDQLEPKDLKELQSFLSFTNFYRRFITSYAQKTLGITNLLKGN